MCAGVGAHATASGRDDNLGYDAEKISTNNSKSLKMLLLYTVCTGI